MSNTEEKPFISIVLPTYNVEKHIDRCLQSCVNQTYKNIEIIVVDDCGQDNSVAVAEKWALMDSRIRIISNTRNFGTYHARRVGTEAANGRYVLFLDPDDELANNAAEVIRKENPRNDVDIIFFSTQQIPAAKTLFRKQKLPKEISNERTAVEEIIKTSNLNYGTPGKAYLINTAKTAFRFLGVREDLRLVYAEDALIFYAILTYTEKFISIPQPLYIYHRNDNSITKNTSEAARKFKTEQIAVIVKIISQKLETSLFSTKDKKNKIALEKIPRKLMSDKYLLERYDTDPSTGKIKYLRSVFSSMLSRRSLADAARVLIFLLSAGKKKL